MMEYWTESVPVYLDCFEGAHKHDKRRSVILNEVKDLL
jgi:hypothetical protein